jgi:hypothetical protein
MVTTDATKDVKKDDKDPDLDEGKITREEFERTMSSQESPKDATKDKAGKQKGIKTDSTKTVVKKAPAREDAEDAKLDDEETAKILDSRVENAEDETRDYEEFLSWKAGERRLRDEERKIKFRAMLKKKTERIKYKLFSKKKKERSRFEL